MEENQSPSFSKKDEKRLLLTRMALLGRRVSIFQFFCDFLHFIYFFLKSAFQTSETV